MSECPSGRYADEIVTVSGLTPKHPLEDHDSTLGIPASLLDWSGSEMDYAQWDALAVALVGRLERAWMMLKSWPSTERMPASEYNALVERITKIRDGYSRLRKPWVNESSAVGTFGWSWGITLPNLAWDASEEIGRMVQLIIDAQCLRQRVDEIYDASGGNPDAPGNTGHKPAREGVGILGTILAVGVGAGVVTGAVILARRIGR